MCGRYTDTRRDKEMLVRMGISHAQQAEIEFVPRYNVAPTQEGSIIVRGKERIELRQARFGLIPFWTKGEREMFVNLRADTLETRPAFRRSLEKGRCLVIADGFYEWQKLGKWKQPYYFRMKEGQQFVFGGIWDRWNGMTSFSIVTVEPNQLVSSIHDRMPLIVNEAERAKWLEKETRLEELSSIMKPYPAREMESYAVRPTVNNAQVDTKECIEPADSVLKPVLQGELEI